MDPLGVYGMFLNNLWSFWISRNLFGLFSLLWRFISIIFKYFMILAFLKFF